MRYTFTARGNKNILATHKNTLEFTKDKELSLDGDCIVGVDADFSLAALKQMASAHNRLRIRISAGGVSDEVDFTANKNFSSDRELVLRFSEFNSDRTFGFRASKSAAHLDRKLASKLGEAGQTVTVEIMPYTKAIIFDFDDTIEDFKAAREHCHKRLGDILLERYGIYESTTQLMLDKIDREFSIKGSGGGPAVYDRHPWFEKFFKAVGVEATPAIIDEMVQAYWSLINEAIKPLPGAAETLAILKKDYVLAMMSDSDGTREIKMARIEKTGLGKFFDVIVTSDEIGTNKPNEKFYLKILNALSVKAEECVMVGDKPQVDLELAKKLGIRTVWMKHGRWSEREAGRKFDFVDFEISETKQLLDVIRQT
jgi:putative hydrolase of the HAD superfamily